MKKDAKFLAVTRDSNGIALTQTECATLLGAKRACSHANTGITARHVIMTRRANGEWDEFISRRPGENWPSILWDKENGQ